MRGCWGAEDERTNPVVRTEHEMAASRQPKEVDPNVDPNLPDGGSETATLDGIFEPAQVVDEVIESPLARAADEPDGGWWVVRVNTDIEHMSVGTIDNSYHFESGRRYKVPMDVMSILAHRDYLLEVPQRVN
jgi:hypothetical protein